MPVKLHIFLIEDDNDDREFLEVALQDNGIPYTLDTVNRGDLAIEWISTFTKLPDIIIMDLNLPKVHGKEVLSQLRKEQKLNNTPLMVLTTSSTPSDKTYCLENGANDFFSKPSDTEGFKSLIIAILKLAGKIEGNN